jgi:hypothetical protein
VARPKTLTMLALRFYWVRSEDREDKYDEVYTLTEMGRNHWLCYASDTEGLILGYRDVKFAFGHMKLVTGVTAARRDGLVCAPFYDHLPVNWVRNQGGGDLWTPPVGVQFAMLLEHSGRIAALLPWGSCGDRRHLRRLQLLLLPLLSLPLLLSLLLPLFFIPNNLSGMLGSSGHPKNPCHMCSSCCRPHKARGDRSHFGPNSVEAFVCSHVCLPKLEQLEQNWSIWSRSSWSRD